MAIRDMSRFSQKKSEQEIELDKLASKRIKTQIKLAMLKNDLTYKQVAERLTEIGRPITEVGLKNKISRCTHQTVWYFDLIRVIEGYD
jgi:hypothetical protein